MWSSVLCDVFKHIVCFGTLQGCMGVSQMFYQLLQPSFRPWSFVTPQCYNAMPAMFRGLKQHAMERYASRCKSKRVSCAVGICAYEEHMCCCRVLHWTVLLQSRTMLRLAAFPTFSGFAHQQALSAQGSNVLALHLTDPMACTLPSPLR